MTASSFYLLRALDVDRGMVHDSQLSIPRIIVCSGNCRNGAGERSTSPAIVCKRSDMFAYCSIWFIATASI
jgi:hypothetical protein